ncbi:hypothetical protein C8J56DRAFT_890219 [Mycena floridula]|nr:hypothetical protein C8J56DRAFT_890219 [Mycena floridula]
MYMQKKLAPVLTKALYHSENSGEQSGLFICFQVPFINHWLLKSVHLPVCFKGDSTNNFTAPNQIGTQRDNHVITTLQYQHIPQPVPGVNPTVPQCPQGEDPFMGVDSDG